MSDSKDSVYRLVEPEAVDVSAIEKELTELWRSTAAAQSSEGAVLRAAAFTVVFAECMGGEASPTGPLIAQLSRYHPSRSILLRLDDAAKTPAQRAWVTAYCHRPSSGTQEVCSEFITLECCGCEARAVGSLLLGLRLSGLPLVLIWDGSLPPDHPLLGSLQNRVERVVTAVVPPDSSAARLETFFHVRESFGPSTVVTDLVESRLRPWRKAIAGQFDAEPGILKDVREIRLSYAAEKIPAEMLLLAAWISEALGWKPIRFGLAGSDPVVTFEGERRIVFDGRNPADAGEMVEFFLRSPSGESTLRVTEPVLETEPLSLLLHELQIWGNDRIREQYLARAQRWLREILFL